MKALVTGATGFVGGAVARALRLAPAGLFAGDRLGARRTQDDEADSVVSWVGGNSRLLRGDSESEFYQAQMRWGVQGS